MSDSDDSLTVDISQRLNEKLLELQHRFHVDGQLLHESGLFDASQIVIEGNTDIMSMLQLVAIKGQGSAE